MTRYRFVCVVGLGLLSGGQAAAQPVSELFTDDVDMPIRVVCPPGDDRLFVVEQDGLIRIFDQAGEYQATFLDATDSTSAGGEQGLLGLAFPPDFATSGRFYINYTDLAGDTHVARLAVSDDDPDQADPSTWETILLVEQPYANHNGGHLAFGPDGYLYVGLGDGGDGGDPEERAQDLSTLLGKMLRIDVSGESGYTVPDDNPFVGEPGRDEIWAYGLRNPWSYDFDSETGDLYLADVGQEFWEEVDVQPAGSSGGENYGWDIMEGAHCYEPPDGCDDTGLVLPVHEYPHDADPARCSISGGQVYRGDALDDLVGHYFFADWCSGEVWSLVWDGEAGVTDVAEWTDEFAPEGGFDGIVSIGRDSDGELYIVDRDGGAIWKIVPGGLTGADDPRPPAAASLAQNAPNPFNPNTDIAFGVPRDGATVALRIYDLEGRLVRTLVDGRLSGGRHAARWDGTDAGGRRVPSGVYLYRLEVDGAVRQRTMVLLK